MTPDLNLAMRTLDDYGSYKQHIVETITIDCGLSAYETVTDALWNPFESIRLHTSFWNIIHVDGVTTP